MVDMLDDKVIRSIGSVFGVIGYELSYLHYFSKAMKVGSLSHRLIVKDVDLC